MIKELTSEQKLKLTEYRDKWIKTGLSTESTNHKRALSNVGPYYEAGGLKPPKTVVFAKSPFAAMVIINILQSDKFWEKLKEELKNYDIKVEKNETGLTVYSAVGSAVHSAVHSAVDSAVGLAVHSAVGSAVYSAVRSAVHLTVRSIVGLAVHSAVGLAVHSAVGSAVYSAVDSAVRSEVGLSKLNWISNFSGGNLWVGWQAFYDFFDKELKIYGIDKIRPTCALSQDVGWIFPYENLCVLVEKPQTLLLDTDGRLHNQNGKCMEWLDSWGFYSMHGVIMPDWVCETKAEDLDAEKIMAISNVEQRLMAIKKIGIERVLKKLKSKQIAQMGDEYVLHEVILEGQPERLLEMQNPSEPKKHFEFVPPEIQTVEQALAWRVGMKEYIKPIAKT